MPGRPRSNRTQWPWLLVFDNVDAPHDYVETFLPRGVSGGLGHILLTSRTPLARWTGAVVQLDCFARTESLRFLRAAGGGGVAAEGDGADEGDDGAAELFGAAEAKSSGATKGSAANFLAEQLGDFPLALAVAVAYMRRCDLSCAEYSRSFSRQRSVLHFFCLLLRVSYTRIFVCSLFFCLLTILLSSPIVLAPKRTAPRALAG